jgi:hypothetical protein
MPTFCACQHDPDRATEGLSMNDRLRQAMSEAEKGDLRPQFNPHAPVVLPRLASGASAIQPILLDRFFQLSCPIADASMGALTAMRLSDAGRFFYLVESLERLACAHIEETLRIILDDFCRLDERSYDELYLWSIVQLSRSNRSHVETYWPLVMALDLRYRATAWQRPAGQTLADQPYRLTDLVFYYYHLYTLRPAPDPSGWLGRRPYPSLVSLLAELLPLLSNEQEEVVALALGEVGALLNRPLLSDFLGLVKKRRRAAEKGDRHLFGQSP